MRVLEKGAAVMHPVYGAGTIAAIEEHRGDGGVERYYVIAGAVSASRLMVPVKQAREIGLRPALESDQVGKVLEFLRCEPVISSEDESASFADDCPTLVLAETVKRLANKGVVAKLTSQERKELKKTRHLLVSELALATGHGQEFVGRMVSECCEEA